jgi:hypothetical protein
MRAAFSSTPARWSVSRTSDSGSGRKRTRWQRERIVAGTRASRAVVSTHTVEAPGSSTDFKSAENWSSRMRSQSRTTTTRREAVCGR